MNSNDDPMENVVRRLDALASFLNNSGHGARAGKIDSMDASHLFADIVRLLDHQRRQLEVLTAQICRINNEKDEQKAMFEWGRVRLEHQFDENWEMHIRDEPMREVNSADLEDIFNVIQQLIAWRKSRR